MTYPKILTIVARNCTFACSVHRVSGEGGGEGRMNLYTDSSTDVKLD